MSYVVTFLRRHGVFRDIYRRCYDPEDVGSTQRVPGDREHEVLLGRHVEDHAAAVCRHAAGYPSHSDTQLRWVNAGKNGGRRQRVLPNVSVFPLCA